MRVLRALVWLGGTHRDLQAKDKPEPQYEDFAAAQFLKRRPDPLANIACSVRPLAHSPIDVKLSPFALEPDARLGRQEELVTVLDRVLNAESIKVKIGPSGRIPSSNTMSASGYLTA
jgi:hypothetical protein